jgi:PIN domain nuclease of toxin-antitoxin system
MILLDTHVWIWWLADRSNLSPAARTAVEEAVAHDTASVSAMSLWEIAMLVKKGRLELTLPVRDWLAKAQTLSGFRFVPVEPRIAVESVHLDMAQQDPVDRILVATALDIPAKLVTRDSDLLDLAIVETIW